MSAKESVFELIEINQCDDNYQPLGIFKTLAEAVELVEAEGHGICLNDPEDWASVEIKERTFGMSDNGKTVWRRVWERNFDAEDFPKQWEIRITETNPKP